MTTTPKSSKELATTTIWPILAISRPSIAARSASSLLLLVLAYILDPDWHVPALLLWLRHSRSGLSMELADGVWSVRMMVALCFMELAAKYPVAGSVYNWAKTLGSKVVGWSAGWLMLTASIVTLSAVVLALQINLPRLWPGFQVIGDGSTPSSYAANAVLLGTIMITITTIINAKGVKLMAMINSAGVLIELIAAILIAAVLLAFNIKRGPAVFLHQRLGEGSDQSYFSLFLIASLASGYVMYGFDTASSLGEETMEPRRTAPKAILRAILASFVIGGAILVFGIMAAPNIYDPMLGSPEGSLQWVVEQVMWGPLGTIFLMCIVVAVIVCSLAVHTAAIRADLCHGQGQCAAVR